jgi:hypothetical protein
MYCKFSMPRSDLKVTVGGHADQGWTGLKVMARIQKIGNDLIVTATSF